MTTVKASDSVIVDILQVLKRTEETLDKQDKRFEQIENLVIPPTNVGKSRKHPAEKSAVENAPFTQILTGEAEHNSSLVPRKPDRVIGNQLPSLLCLPIDLTLAKGRAPRGPKIPYKDWSFNQLNG